MHIFFHTDSVVCTKSTTIYSLLPSSKFCFQILPNFTVRSFLFSPSYIFLGESFFLMAELKIGKKNCTSSCTFQKALLWPWLSRIHYFWSKKQNLSSHLQSVISENCRFFAKNQLFSEIASSRWQEKNNRWLFSITGISRRSGPINMYIALFFQISAHCKLHCCQ